MNRLILSLGTIFVGVLLLGVSTIAEEITLITYYPAPYGVYNELTTTGNTYLATTSGNVGIGTTSPGAKLEVKNGAADTWGIKLLNATSSNIIAGFYETITGVGQFYLYDAWNNNTVKFDAAGDSFITGGNVGIGTTNPNEKLEVDGKIRANTAFNLNGDDGDSGSFDVIIDLRIVGAGAGAQLQKQKRAITISGGIVTDIGPASWETVGSVNP